jgi:hypothetical protein
MSERNFEGGRFRNFRKRILGEEEGKSLFGDAKDVLGSVLEGSEKLRGELFRVVAREVRAYLEESGLKDDLHNLLTNYAFELHLSMNLRKLTDEDRKGKRRRKGRGDEPPPPSEPISADDPADEPPPAT